MIRLGRRMWWAALAALAWLSATAIVYFVFHKPIGLNLAFSLLEIGRDLLVASGILAVSGGLGRRILPAPHPDPLARHAAQAAAGLGLWAVAWLGLGFVGALAPWAAWAALAVAALILRADVVGWAVGLGQALRSAAPRGIWAVGVVAAATTLFGLTLMEALAPAMGFDALVYHLTLPAEFVRQGRLSLTTWNPYWGQPLGSEMLYMWAIALGRPPSAAVLGWGIGALALLGAFGLARSFGPLAGWGALAALLAGGTTVALLGEAYADFPAMLYGGACVVVLDGWRREPHSRGPWWAGVLAGFAFGTKYTGAVVLPSAVAMLAVSLGFRRVFRPMLAMTAGALLASAPWLVKNLFVTGVPLYPFLGTTPWVDPLQQFFFRNVQWSRTWWETASTPIAASLKGVEGAPGFAADIGPWLIGLLPGLAFVRRSHRQTLIPLAAFVAIGWTVWIVAGATSELLGQTRLYYALLPAWAALSGAGLAGLSRCRLGSIRLGRIARALMALTLGLVTLGYVGRVAVSHPLAPILGLESPEAYRARRLGAYGPAMRAIRDLGAGASVLMLWEPRGLDCRPTCRPDVWLDRWSLDRARLGTADRILAAWREAGATHLLLHAAGMTFVRAHEMRYSAADWEELDRLLLSLPDPVRFGDGYELFPLGT